MSLQWFYKIMGEERGPVSSSGLKALADDGAINRDTLLRRTDQENWHLADEIQGLFAALSMPDEAAEEDDSAEIFDHVVQTVSQPAPPTPPPVVQTAKDETHAPPPRSFRQLLEANAEWHYRASGNGQHEFCLADVAHESLMADADKHKLPKTEFVVRHISSRHALTVFTRDFEADGAITAGRLVRLEPFDVIVLVGQALVVKESPEEEDPPHCLIRARASR